MLEKLIQLIYKLHNWAITSPTPGSRNGRKFMLCNMLLASVCMIILFSLYTGKLLSDTVLVALIATIPVVYAIYCYGNVVAKQIVSKAGLIPNEPSQSAPDQPPTKTDQ